MGKFSLHLELMTQWRGRELCGHYPSFSLSRKLQSSLVFKGNYFDEPVICSGDGITQSSPESSCMKKLEDASEEKHREKRGDGAEDKKTGPCFTQQATGVGDTTSALSLWVLSFLWTPGPGSGSPSTPCSRRTGEGKALPSSQQQGKF